MLQWYKRGVPLELTPVLCFSTASTKLSKSCVSFVSLPRLSVLFLFGSFPYSSLIEPLLSIFEELLKIAGLGINICPVISKRNPSLHSFYFDRHSSCKHTNRTLTMNSLLLSTCRLYQVNHAHVFFLNKGKRKEQQASPEKLSCLKSSPEEEALPSLHILLRNRVHDCIAWFLLQ